MTNDLYQTAGNLYWYRHDGWQDGTESWKGKTLVGRGGWDKYASAFASCDGAIYAIDTYGNLYWYWHDGGKDGDGHEDAADRWKGRNLVGRGGWQDYKSVFASSNGVLYAIGKDGNLYWYRHDGWQDGSERWTGKTLVGRGGWNEYTSVFASAGGVIYAIGTDGNLYWYRHDGWQDGTERWTGKTLVGRGGWDQYASAFASAGGVIYGVAANGDLYWCRHDGQRDGDGHEDAADRWKGRNLVGRGGWYMYKSVFATSDGTLYGVGLDTMSWMSVIPPSRRLTEFTIPGTHDTGTWPLPWKTVGFDNNAKCQSLSLQEQLDAGIRFLDVRVAQDTRGGKPDFQIRHGSSEQGNTGLWFSTDIVAVCRQFLRDHPTETIIMSVKDEYGSTDNFEAHLQLYLTADLCYRGHTVPALWNARGNIVLIRRYEFGTSGIPARPGWPDDTTGQCNNGYNLLNIQDVYGFGFLNEAINEQSKRAKLDKKWTFVEKHLGDAASEMAPIVWWINFASASGPPTILDPVDFAKGNWGSPGLNANIDTYLAAHQAGHFGAVLMDFPEHPNDGELIKRLIRSNLHV